MSPAEERVGLCATSRNGTFRSGREPPTYTLRLAGRVVSAVVAAASRSITSVIAASLRTVALRCLRQDRRGAPYAGITRIRSAVGDPPVTLSAPSARAPVETLGPLAQGA